MLDWWEGLGRVGGRQLRKILCVAVFFSARVGGTGGTANKKGVTNIGSL